MVNKRVTICAVQSGVCKVPGAADAGVAAGGERDGRGCFGLLAEAVRADDYRGARPLQGSLAAGSGFGVNKK
eukprot:535055-Prorocentrum_minimum.AAC.3